MKQIIEKIDSELGKGFAAKHPAVLAEAMRQDYENRRDKQAFLSLGESIEQQSEAMILNGFENADREHLENRLLALYDMSRGDDVLIDVEGNITHLLMPYVSEPMPREGEVEYHDLYVGTIFVAESIVAKRMPKRESDRADVTMEMILKGIKND